MAPDRTAVAAVVAALLASLGQPVVARNQDQVMTTASFQSTVDLVTLDVHVMDRSGRQTAPLAPGDFVVLDNGAPQRISIFWPVDTMPLSVILLIDRSASMAGPKLERAVSAAAQFADTLDRDDHLEVIAFDLRAEWVHPFASDPSTVRAALATLRPGGTTSLFEALSVAVNDIARARRTRPREFRDVIVLLSDGEDTSSVVAFEDVLDLVRRSGVLVYAVALRSDGKDGWLGPTWPLMQLARDTGGRALGVPTLDALPALYREIASEIRHLYRIGYVPGHSRSDGAWRSVTVRVLNTDMQARTRAGYYAPRHNAR